MRGQAPTWGKDGEGDSLFPVGVMSLDEFSESHPKVALAFSGGCDSSYLLSALIDRSVQVKAYLVNTAFQYPFELEDAVRVVAALAADFEVIEADVLSNGTVCGNPPDRCYFCKRFIFGNIQEKMALDGFDVLVDGTNASDDPAHRPGFRALAELGVLSPLRLAGLTKEDVRAASKARGLFTWEKPRFSCLATKIETGTPITAERLAAVFESEGATTWN